MKVLIIFNPRAGRDGTRDHYDSIIRVFRNYGFTVTEKTTTCVGDATELVKKFARGNDLVVCCGGDGTFNETVAGMVAINSKTPILYYPMGSTNDLANTIGATKDLPRQIELFLHNQICSYDIGRLNGRYFTYIAGFGVGTDISFATPQKLKNKLGHFAYLLNGFFLNLPQQIKNLKPHHMAVTCDGQRIEDDFYFGLILNTNEVGGIFKLDKRNVKLNDGIFDVMFIRNVKGVPDVFRLIRKLVRQEFDSPQIVMLSASRLQIECEDPLSWTLDGEYGGRHTDVTFDVLHGQVNLVAPAGKYLIPTQAAPAPEDDVFAEERARRKEPKAEKPKPKNKAKKNTGSDGDTI